MACVDFHQQKRRCSPAGSTSPHDCFENPMDPAGVPLKIAQKRLGGGFRLPGRVPQQPRTGVDSLHLTRQGVGLRIVHHLQFVLDIAQEQIRTAKRFEILDRDQRVIAQCVERTERVALQYLGEPAPARA